MASPTFFQPVLEQYDFPVEVLLLHRFDVVALLFCEGLGLQLPDLILEFVCLLTAGGEPFVHGLQIHLQADIDLAQLQ